jgi:GxxExxY protein
MGADLFDLTERGWARTFSTERGSHRISHWLGWAFRRGSLGLAFSAASNPVGSCRNCANLSPERKLPRFFDGPFFAAALEMSSTNHIDLLHRDFTDRILRGFYDTYNELGFGFPEFVCAKALAVTLLGLGLEVTEESRLPVYYRGQHLVTFRADLVVNRVVIVEVKVSHGFEPYQPAQLRNYLRASGLSVGLLLSFGREPRFKRVVFEHAARSHPIRDGSQDVSNDTETI